MNKRMYKLNESNDDKNFVNINGGIIYEAL